MTPKLSNSCYYRKEIIQCFSNRVDTVISSVTQFSEVELKHVSFAMAVHLSSSDEQNGKFQTIWLHYYNHVMFPVANSYSLCNPISWRESTQRFK